jgi:hypothetical protein
MRNELMLVDVYPCRLEELQRRHCSNKSVNGRDPAALHGPARMMNFEGRLFSRRSDPCGVAKSTIVAWEGSLVSLTDLSLFVRTPLVL